MIVFYLGYAFVFVLRHVTIQVIDIVAACGVTVKKTLAVGGRGGAVGDTRQPVAAGIVGINQTVNTQLIVFMFDQDDHDLTL